MPKIKWERQALIEARAFAVYAVDPGGTTGAAWGVFLPQGTLHETLRAHSVEAREFFGSTLNQAFDITEDILARRARWNAAGIRDVIVVFESFKLRTGLADLSSVEVISATQALLIERAGVTVEFQGPADAKRFATADRLKRWGLYVVGRGSDHKRDALRHLSLCVSRRLG